MHRIMAWLLATSALLNVSPLNAAPAHDWSYSFGGPGANTAYDVAVDPTGGVVVAGAFSASMNIGGAPLTSAGAFDVFLAKFDPTGAPQWSKRFGASGADVAAGVAIDPAGNITITGYFQGTVSFGGAALVSKGGDDIFVAKFDAAGNPLWSRGYGTTRDDEGHDVASDALGNLIMTGHYGSAIDFGGGTAPFVGSVDSFILKLDGAGAYQWHKVAGSTNLDEGFGVAVDASNNIAVTGSFFSTVNFGGSNLVSAGLSDAFVVKYRADGTHLWSTRVGASGISESGQAVAINGSGGVVVTGADRGAFLVKYDTDGVKQWTRNFTSNVDMQGLDVAFGPNGTIAMTGDLQGSTNFGGGAITSAGDDDIFLAVFDATGVHHWSQRFGNTLDDWGYACAFDASSALIATGIFSSTVNFGGAMLTSLGNSDVYLVKFDNPLAVDSTPPLITCPADIQVEQASPAGTPASNAVIAVFLAGATTSDDTDPSPVITNDAPATFPPGTTPVTFRATDATGNHAECTAHVMVLDSTPPEIAVALDKTMLWPPNHKFVTVCAQVTVSDDGTAQPAWTLVSITCNEDADGHGDGHTQTDYRDAQFGTADRCVDLRAERAGNGDGRVYELFYSVRDASGNTTSVAAHVRVPHDMSDFGATQGAGSLTSVHPNPFNPQTTVAYFLIESHHVRIDIYDARGSLVRRLVDEGMPAGSHSTVWNGADDAGHGVGSGIYFVKMRVGTDIETRKIVLLK
jgi:hypothetical protein